MQQPPVLLGNSQVIVDELCWCLIQQSRVSAAPPWVQCHPASLSCPLVT